MTADRRALMEYARRLRAAGLPVAEIARQVGHSRQDVHTLLGTKTPRPAPRRWTPAEDALLGTMTDREVAARLGRSVHVVAHRRQRLGILPLRGRTAGAVG